MSLLERRAEFEANLWDHAADAFQLQFDERRPLTDGEQGVLAQIYKAALIADDARASEALRKVLLEAPTSFAVLLQVSGLTRTKIISDLRADTGARAGTVKIPSSYKGLTKSAPWALAAPYLLTRLRSILGSIRPRGNSLADVFETLNQATWAGYIRQERAKRSGHEAEYRLATLLASVGIPFQPFGKAENPLCPDAQIDGISFDLVIPDVSGPEVVVKATVHTANIGQFGESKDDLEIREARDWIDRTYGRNSAPVLLAFADGVGFHSNRAGLDGVLSHADEFCQFKTVWKAVLIAASRLDLPIEVALMSADRRAFKSFIDRWGGRRVVALEKLASAADWLEVGNAFIRRTD